MQEERETRHNKLTRILEERSEYRMLGWEKKVFSESGQG